MIPIKKLRQNLGLNLEEFIPEKFDEFVERHNIEQGNDTIPYAFTRWFLRKHFGELSLQQEIEFFTSRSELKNMEYVAKKYGCTDLWVHLTAFVAEDKTEYIVFNPQITEENAKQLIADIQSSEYMEFINKYINLKAYDDGPGFWQGGTRCIVFESHEK